MIGNEITRLIENWSIKDLTILNEYISNLISKKKQEKRGKRSEDRIKTNITGTCIIEREQAFFNAPHRINILDLSTKGICFKTSALIFAGDMLSITFRSPHKATLKNIYAEVIRVGNADTKGIVEVAAKGISYRKIMEYRSMLENRGKINV